MEGAPSCWPRGRRRQPPADAAESGGLCLEGQRAARRTARPQPASLLSNRHYPLGKAKALPLAKAAPSSPLRTLGVDSHRPTWWVGDPPPACGRHARLCWSAARSSLRLARAPAWRPPRRLPTRLRPLPTRLRPLSPQPVLSPVITPRTPFPTEALGPRGGRCGLERLVSLGCGDPPLKRALTPGAVLWGGGALSPHGEHSAAGSQTPLGSAHGGPRQPGVLPAEQLRSPHWDSKQIDWLFELLSHKTAPQTAPRWREAHATGRRGSGSERGASPSPPPGVPAPAGAATEGPAVHPAPSSSPHLTAFPSPSTALLPGARPPLTRLLFPSPSSISPTHRSCQVSLQTVFTRGLKSQIVLVCRFVSSGSPLDAQP